MMRTLLIACLLATPAAAADFSFDGYGDIRLVSPASSTSFLDGGLGKLRFGKDDEGFKPGDLVGEGRVLLAPEWMATATARVNAEYGPGVDLIEAYLRYRPVSTSAWRWSVKVGAFFPPLSLENDQVGWTSFWTITPSAINSWVGDELRVVGAEGTLEWRRESGALTLSGAVFGWNDPAGVMIADRGWVFDDHPSGLFQREALPGGYGRLFTEMDGRPGWYLDLSWEPADIGGFEIMRYDNAADPTVIKDGQIAWHTSFWDLGFEKQLGKITLLSQAMSGTTTIVPSPFYRQTTDFKSAYALLGYDMDAWWAAARADIFQTRTSTSIPSISGEDGHAYTLSLTYLPRKWLRFTGEILSVDSSPNGSQTQFQLLARLYF
jgi:hypothetical protein